MWRQPSAASTTSASAPRSPSSCSCSSSRSCSSTSGDSRGRSDDHVRSRSPAPVIKDRASALPAKIGRAVTKPPVHIFLLFIGVLWLDADARAFLESLLSPTDVAQRLVEGDRDPHLATWANYSNVWHGRHPDVAPHHAEIAIGGTFLPILVAALAGYAFAWVDSRGATGCSSS